MAIRKELLDELLAGYQKPEDLMGENGVLQQLTKALIERVLEGGNDPSSGLRETLPGREKHGQFAERKNL